MNKLWTKKLLVKTRAQGLHEVTDQIFSMIRSDEVRQGLCNIFICHTSASLTIQENADPSAKRDLENWLNRLVPENDSLYTHTSEGPDDMPAHVKAILTNVSLTIPIYDYNLGLGTWQGIYLWEHRKGVHSRSLLVTVSGNSI